MAQDVTTKKVVVSVLKDGREKYAKCVVKNVPMEQVATLFVIVMVEIVIISPESACVLKELTAMKTPVLKGFTERTVLCLVECNVPMAVVTGFTETVLVLWVSSFD